MPKLKFIDTHFHLWDFHHPEIDYEWLEPDSAPHPLLGELLNPLKGVSYLVDDYISETRISNVKKAIHVQAAVGTKDPVKETAWLQLAADMTGFPHGIVAYSNLKNPRIEEELAHHCEYPNMRGIRDFSDGDYLVDPSFHRGYALLEKFNLVSSLDVRWENMHKARDLAMKFPNIPLVIDHAGVPEKRTAGYFKNWQQAIRVVAQAKNTVCKISGLGMFDYNWTVESIRPWILHCIDAFGIDRCVFGTNWPMDKLFSSYDVLIESYQEIIADFTFAEKVAMFSGNAEKLYRI